MSKRLICASLLLIAFAATSFADCHDWICSPHPPDGAICTEVLTGPRHHQAVDCDTRCDCAPDPTNGYIVCHCYCEYISDCFDV